MKLRPRISLPHSSHGAQAQASDKPRDGVRPSQIAAVPRGGPIPLPLEIAFLSSYGFAASMLLDAARHARSQGVTADVALIALGMIDESAYYQALARHLGVHFVDQPVHLAVNFDVREAISSGLAPLAGGGEANSSYLVAPRGEQLLTLLRYSRRGPHFVGRICITTPSLFAQFVRAHGHYYIRHRASFAIQEWDAQLSAGTPTTLAQRFLIILALALTLACLAWGNISRLCFSLVFSGMMIYAAVLRVCAAFASRDERHVPIRPIPENQFPVYTILVPLYRESAVVAQLINQLDKLDYPRAKLDIKILIEHDDVETMQALAQIKLAPVYEVIRVPNGQPRTKPRALNVGLMFARGDLLVVYDAEDIPDDDQLRRAAMRFAHEPRKVACVQARLAIDNHADNWLAAAFALEYASLFDVLIPGLVELSLPVPLGGTSNHFRTQILRELQAWDAWNVTEDADLGLRLARFGYRVEALFSTTHEEAPAAMRAWIAQRQRWLKGWMQTLIVLSRQPLRLFRELGLWAALSTYVFLGSGVFGPLLAPIFLALFVHDVAYSALLEPSTPVEIFSSTIWCFLIVSGMLSSSILLYMGMQRRHLMALWPNIPMLFMRQLLLSYAAWTAILDFIRRPFYWSKTTHGLARTISRPTPRRRQP
jgi:glycosyltransferase XagB